MVRICLYMHVCGSTHDVGVWSMAVMLCFLSIIIIIIKMLIDEHYKAWNDTTKNFSRVVMILHL